MTVNNKQNYCTLFDSRYLSRGLALYQSLTQHADNFHLYVLAMDNKCAEILSLRNLSNLTVISLSEFETDNLLKIKPERSAGEYCWTCSSFIIKHCIEKFSLDACTYLDADIFFFSNPRQLINEIPTTKSVLITDHRYTEKYDQTATSGRFCVQFMTFKNTPQGMEILNHWGNQCLEWCFNRIEDNRFGDQKYLDPWPELWPDDVHILEHLGGGLAPWNIQQYTLEKENDQLIVKTQSNQTTAAVFYHFHALRFILPYYQWVGRYAINKQAKSLIYSNYSKKITQLSIELDIHDPLWPSKKLPYLARIAIIFSFKILRPSSILKV